MIRSNVLQGSPEWHALHIGRPTASGFDKILTTKTRKPSAQAERYLHELCTGWLLGQLPDTASTGWMARGLELEAEAVAYYEFQRDVTVDRVGFCTTDDGRYGCSPDFLLDDGGGEIKCLSAVNHVGALLGATDDSYALQVQGCMLVTGAAWWDRIWWNPAIKPLIVRVERDEELCDQLREALDDFCDRLAAMKKRLLDLGVKPRQTAQDGAGGTEPDKPDLPGLPDAPEQSRHERAVEVAKDYLALADEQRAPIRLTYMLTEGEAIVRSIEGLSDGLLAELSADIGMEKL